MTEARKTAPLPEPLAARVKKLALEIGDIEAGRLLGCARTTVIRAAAGFPVRPSVAIAIETLIASAEAA